MAREISVFLFAVVMASAAGAAAKSGSGTAPAIGKASTPAISAKAPIKQEPTEVPTWRSRASNFKKITENRAVIVSVNSHSLGDGESELTMDGGGLIDAKPEDSFRLAQEYDNLKRVSDHIVEVRKGPNPDDLFLHTEAFHYHARMQMKVKSVTKPVRQLQFKVVSGNFQGMTGQFSFENYKGKTLMGFHADYKYKVLPMPAFFLDFALEAVLQHVAKEMRSFLEDPKSKR